MTSSNAASLVLISCVVCIASGVAPQTAANHNVIWKARHSPSVFRTDISFAALPAAHTQQPTVMKMIVL